MRKVKVYPAIDLMNGKAVRLFKGQRNKVKVYGDPIEIAKGYAKLVDKIHVVDLDGAFGEKPKNLGVIKAIIEETGLKVQAGGGFKCKESIKEAYSIGVSNVIIGTKAFDLGFLREITQEFEGVTVSLDSKDGRIAVKGWEEVRPLSVKEAYKMLRKYVKRFVYTAVERDGTLSGIDMLERFWENEEFIYAGGVSSISDMLKLKEKGFSGVIVGKALYEGKFDLKGALEALRC